MTHNLTKHSNIPTKDKFSIHLDVYPNTGDCGFVIVSTEEGHNQEFYDVASTFVYIVLEGSGTFFLDDEPVDVAVGDHLVIQPKTRIYYKGSMKLNVITNPAWRPENEVETKAKIW